MESDTEYCELSCLNWFASLWQKVYGIHQYVEKHENQGVFVID